MSNQERSKQLVMLGMFVTSMAMTAETAHAAPNPRGQRQRDVFGGYSSTQIVVKLRPEAVATPAARQHFRTTPHGADPRAALSGAVRAAAADWGALKMRPAYSDPFADPAAAARHGLDRTFIIEVPEGTDTEAMAAAFWDLREDIEVATVDTIGGVADVIPNDTNFSLQYAMHNTGQTGGTPDADIDAPAAWALHTGDFGTVTIAIIDSGVNSHNDYGTNAAPYPNGRIVQGRNTANPLTPNATTDGCPHGTHVAGIAAASGNNNRGVAGVTWGAYIMPVRVLRDPPNGCNGVVSALADGIKWAADNGADVGNISLQYYDLTQAEYNLLSAAINYAHDLGMILIAAAGNDNVGGLGFVAYPAKMPNCMAVSATMDEDLFATNGGICLCPGVDVVPCNTPNSGTCTEGRVGMSCTVNDYCDTAVWSSNYGNEVDVCAPGDRIYSTWTSNGYVYSYGTSMATPHVSGLAALIKSYATGLTNTHIEMILYESADDLGPTGWDNHYGVGRINAHNALLRAQDWFDILLYGDPPDGAIDARKPIDRDGNNVYGWNSVDLTFGLITLEPSPSDFTVSQAGGVSAPPTVATVEQVSSPVLRVGLDSMIEPKTWTTITHVPSAVSVRLGYLPGDVNANRVSDAADVTTMVDTLRGVLPAKPIWSMDINRSEAVTGADALEVVDLLNGAEAYEAFLGATLP